MTNTNFFIVGKHPVIEALKNPQRKVLRLFLTEESKKNIHRISPKKNLLKDVKVFFKTKKELDKYCKNEQILHQGYVAEDEKLEEKSLKEFKFGGGGKIRTFEDRSQRVYSPPHLTALVPLLKLSLIHI